MWVGRDKNMRWVNDQRKKCQEKFKPKRDEFKTSCT